MGTTWQGGDNFVLVKRGSSVSRKGGTHSGPSGKRYGRFRADNHNPLEQSKRDRARHVDAVKSGKRVVKYIKSGLSKKESLDGTT